MIKAEKKTGMVEATKRHNLTNVGYVCGPVTELKGGNKEICIEDGNVIMYLANDFDVTLSPSDVTEWCLWSTGIYFRNDPSVNSSNSQFDETVGQYVNEYKFRFSNGTYGVVKTHTMQIKMSNDYFIPNDDNLKEKIYAICSFNKDAKATVPYAVAKNEIQRAVNKIAKLFNIKNPKEPVSKFAIEINGWLTPSGEMDENYDNDFCPKGYLPDIIGIRCMPLNLENENFRKLSKGLNLFEGDAILEDVYGKRTAIPQSVLEVNDVIKVIYKNEDEKNIPEELLKHKEDKIPFIWNINAKKSYNLTISAAEVQAAIKEAAKEKMDALKGKLFGKKKK